MVHLPDMQWRLHFIIPVGLVLNTRIPWLIFLKSVGFINWNYVSAKDARRNWAITTANVRTQTAPLAWAPSCLRMKRIWKSGSRCQITLARCTDVAFQEWLQKIPLAARSVIVFCPVQNTYFRLGLNKESREWRCHTISPSYHARVVNATFDRSLIFCNCPHLSCSNVRFSMSKLIFYLEHWILMSHQLSDAGAGEPPWLGCA